jgi:hypothetical protein
MPREHPTRQHRGAPLQHTADWRRRLAPDSAGSPSFATASSPRRTDVITITLLRRDGPMGLLNSRDGYARVGAVLLHHVPKWRQRIPMPPEYGVHHVSGIEAIMTAFRTMAGIAALFTVGVVATACGNSTTEAGRGTLAVQLTDAAFPTDSVLRVDVYVVRVDARMADTDSAAAARGATDDSANTGGWTTITRPNQIVNLLAYQNGAFLPLGNAGVAAGNYNGFRLVIDPSKSSLTLKNGAVLTSTSTPNVLFPSGARSGIKIVFLSPVPVAANDTTTVLVDFMVNDSFVMRGNSISLNGLLFKPVIKGTVRP